MYPLIAKLDEFFDENPKNSLKMFVKTYKNIIDDLVFCDYCNDSITSFNNNKKIIHENKYYQVYILSWGLFSNKKINYIYSNESIIHNINGYLLEEYSENNHNTVFYNIMYPGTVKFINNYEIISKYGNNITYSLHIIKK
jgi:hypothetical protein